MSSHYQIFVDCLTRWDRYAEFDQDDHMTRLREQVFAPVVWCRLASGFKIQDLTELLYAQALDLMKKYYMEEDILCKILLSDYISRRSFYSACLFQMKDASSLAIVKEGHGKDELVGVCLVKAVKRFDFGRVFSRTIMRQGEAYNKITDFKTELNRRVDIYADYDCEIFLRIYSICIRPEYRGRGLGFELMRTVIQVARASKIPIAMGIFTTHKMQEYATRLGFFVATDIRYDDWKNAAGNVIFTDDDPKNETCALMVAKVKPELYPDFLTGKLPEPPVEVKGKKGKADKKKGKKK